MKYTKSERFSYGLVGGLCIVIGYAFNVQGLNVVSQNVILQWGLPLLITALQFSYSYSRHKPGALLTTAAVASYGIGIFWNAIGIADVSNFNSALGEWSFWVGGTIIFLMAALIDLVAEPSLHIAIYGEEGNDIFNVLLMVFQKQKQPKSTQPGLEQIQPKPVQPIKPMPVQSIRPEPSARPKTFYRS